MTQLLPVYVKSAIMLTDASNNCDLEVNMELYIGQNLKNFRKARNLTQEEVAKHLGISFQSISKWERNDGYPDITMLPGKQRDRAVPVTYTFPVIFQLR